MASNALGTLSIEVLAQIASAVSDLGKLQAESAKTVKEIQTQWQDSADGISESFKKLGEIVGVSLGVDALKEFAGRALETSEQVDHMSQMLGVSVESIQTMGYAAGLVGGNLDTATTAMARLEKSTELAAAGSKQQVEAFRAIGISASDLTELLKNPDDLIQTVAQHLSSFGDGAGKTAVTIQLFGRGAAELIPYLNELGKNFEDLQGKAAQFGIVLSAADQQALVSTQIALNALGEQIKGLGNQFAVSLAPAIKEIVADISKLAQSSQVASAFQAIGAAAKLVADNIGLIGVAIEVLIAKAAIQWFVGAATAIAAVTKEVVIGVAVWGEMTGAIAAAGTVFAGTLAAGEAFTAGMAGLLGIVGGIPGVIALLGVGIYELATYEDDAAKAADSLRQAEELLKGVTADSVAGDLAHAASLQKLAQQHIDAGMAALSQMEAEAALRNSGGGFGEDAALAANSYALLDAEIDKLRTQLKQEQSDLENQHTAINVAIGDFRQFSAEVINVAKSFTAGDISGNVTKFVAGSNDIHAAAARMIADGNDATVVHAQEDAAIAKLSTSLDAASLAQVNYNAKVGAVKDTTAQLSTEMEKWQAQMDALTGKSEGVYDAAWNKFGADMAKFADELVVMQQHGLSAAAAQDMMTAAVNAGMFATEHSLDLDQKKNDAAQKYIDTLNKQLSLIGNLTDAQKAAAEFDAIAAKNIDTLHDAYGNLYSTKQEVIDANAREKQGFVDDVAAINAATDAAKQNAEQLKQWQTIATNAFDSAFSAINKDIVEGGSVMKDLVNVAKTVVEQILLEFEKLAIINPLLNQIFGLSGSSAALPTSSFGDIFNNISGMFSGGGTSGGGIGNLLNSWTGGAGAGLTVDTGGVGGSLGTAELGTGAGAAGSIGVDAGAAGDAVNAGAVSGANGLLSTIGPILGGVMAGYQIGGVGGAVALGVASYFIPVVGWIAAAASIINGLTGGGLFGTAASPIGGNLTETVGQGGGTVTDEMTSKGKKSWFQGSYFTQTDIADPAGQAAMNTFVASLIAGQQAFATSLGDKMTQAITGGSYNQQTDATGKVIAGSGVTKIGGATYTGETDTQFQERLQSGAYLEVLDQMGLGATKFVASTIGNADKYSAAVQDFASATQTANTNLGKGFEFLALGSNETLISVMKFVEGMEKSGETLSAAYARLAQAQSAYDQFVGQFKRAPTYVDPFEASMAQLYAQMKAASAQANALAVAAGASGAATSDLINIQQDYASQMAALTVQLEDSAQQLAFSLGLTNIGSLSQVTTEINALQTQSNKAVTSVNSFSSAMTQVSQSATAAINLLLGNLSPLNDQQKLQDALQGMRAGTVTADQVLTIGRSLYASSQAYNDLFNEVMPYAGQTVGGVGGGSSRSGTTTTSTAGLSPADQAKLNALLKEQTDMQAAATLGQYQTLAQQIEEIANAKGETFQQVIKDMGVSMKDLEKGLGLKNDADLSSYMQALQKQVDSAGNNTTSIVSAVNNVSATLEALFSSGRVAASATPGGRTFVPGTHVTPGDQPPATQPGGHGNGNGGGGDRTNMASSTRYFSDSDAHAFAMAFVNQLNGSQSQYATRSNRQTASVR